jgi:hypothetical protein
MINEPARQIIEMVARKAGVRANAVSLETKLLHDLGIDGDDAEEFLTDFAHEFSVDMTGFSFMDHFGAELWWRFLPTFFGCKPGDYERKQPLTVKDLIAAAERKHWRTTP